MAVLKCQRDPLDEQFDELFKDMSEELREKIDMELATGGDAATAAYDDSDTDVLVVEYVSDDENLVPADSVNPDDENDDESDHVLKASIVVVVTYYFHFYWAFWINKQQLAVLDIASEMSRRSFIIFM